MLSPPGEITQLLTAWSNGDRQALARLIPLVYDDLRRLAAYHMKRERCDHTLEPTALVHEAYMRLDESRLNCHDRTHFYAVASKLMRRILVDHARGRRAGKRGNGAARVSLEEARTSVCESAMDLISLDDAMNSLAAIDERKVRIIELRFFGGLTIEETATVIGLSTASVIVETRLARAWLFNHIRKEAGNDSRALGAGSGNSAQNH